MKNKQNEEKDDHIMSDGWQIIYAFGVFILIEAALILVATGFWAGFFQPFFQTQNHYHGKLFSTMIMAGLGLLIPLLTYHMIRKPFWRYEDPPEKIKSNLSFTTVVGLILIILGFLLGIFARFN